MRDPGLEEAIRVAGGVGRLSRALGIAQPSVSSWRRVPAERVIDIEKLTGVARHELRPDLYPPEVAAGEVAAPGDREVDETDLARAAEYRLLATLLVRAPDAELLGKLGRLRGDATPLGLAHAALAEVALRTDPRAVEREFYELFIGLGRGELLPYASYYLTGFLHERPLAAVRAEMARLGLRREPGRFEPEDHAGTLFEVMAGLLAGSFDADPGAADRFFKLHIGPWARRFMVDLEGAGHARLYRVVGTLGRTFLEIEAEAAELPEMAA